MMRTVNRLRDARQGGLGPLVALAMPVLIGAGALAVDIGSIQLETRRLQGVADAAALSAAAQPDRAQARAVAMADGSGWNRPFDVAAIPGRYAGDASLTPVARFTAGGARPNAVEVTITTHSPTFLARILGRRDVAIARSARAARIDYAALSVGSRLAAIDGGILNAYLSALTGSSLSLSVADYNALAGADIDLFSFIDALNTSANLNAGSYDQILASQVTAPQLLNAAGLAAIDNARVQELLAQIAARAGAGGGGNVTLDGLIDLGPLGAQDRVAGGPIRINALTMLTTLLQQSGGQRQVALDLNPGIAGLAQTRMWLAIGERPQGSPWIAVSDAGTPIVRSAQTRVYLEARLANVSLPGIGSLVAMEVPLFVELAAAEARIDAVSCPADGPAIVDVGARPGLGTIALGNVDTRRLNDFSRAMTIDRTKLVDTLLIDVEARGVLALGSSEPWQTVRFTRSDIDTGIPRTVSSSAAVQGLTASLIGATTLTPRVLGLPVATGPLLAAVGNSLNLAAPALDGLINLATGTLGVRYGQADVWVTGLRCGQPTLVG